MAVEAGEASGDVKLSSSPGSMTVGGSDVDTMRAAIEAADAEMHTEAASMAPPSVTQGSSDTKLQ